MLVPSRAHRLIAVAVTACIPAALAQDTTSLEDQLADDDTVVLAPFEVNTEKDVGYAAQNTISGSRLNTSLADTPAAISVFTQEFIQDIGATSIEDLTEYSINTRNNLGDGPTASLTNNDPIIQVRGISAGGGGGRFTNFFRSSVSQDTYNMERAELTRGPNSVLFGMGQPSGGFNVATKKANVKRRTTSASFRFGSYDQTRVSLDTNQPIIKDVLALRLSALTEQGDNWRPFAFNDNQRWQLAARWQIARNTRIDVEYEEGDRTFANAPRSGILDSLTPWIAAGRQLDTTIGQPPGWPARLDLADAGMTLVTTANSLVYDMSSGIVYNVRNQSVGAPAGETPGQPAVQGESNPMLQDFSIVPRKVFIAGPGYGTDNEFDRLTVTGSHELFDNFFIEGAYNRENVVNLARDTVGSANRILVDTNAFLPDGTPNPHAGEYYTEQYITLRNRDTTADDYRITGSYEFDLTRRDGLLKWLGSHRLAAMFQGRETHNISDQEREFLIENPINTSRPDHNANLLRRRTYLDLSQPLTSIGMIDYRDHSPNGMINQSDGNTVQTAFLPFGQPRDVMEKNLTNLYVWQASLLKDHLVATFGYRKDRVRTYQSNPARYDGFGPFSQGSLYAVRDEEPAAGSGITRTQGLVAKPFKWLYLFYNRSSSFSLPALTVQILPGDRAPNATGETNDYGIKFPLFGDKLFATFTYYETDAIDQTRNGRTQVYVNGLNNIWSTLDTAGELAAAGLSIDDVSVFANGYTFDNRASGYEFELTANPTRNLRLIANVSTNETIQSDSGLEIGAYYDANSDFFLAGDRGRLVINGTPGEMAATAIDPDDGVTTIAEQLQANLDTFDRIFVRPDGVRQLGEPVATANLRATYSHREGMLRGLSWGAGVRWRGERVISYTSSDPATREEIRGGDTYTVDANLGYRRKIRLFGDNRDISIQLNVKNLLDDDDLVFTRAFDDGTPSHFTMPAPRSWFITTTLNF